MRTLAVAITVAAAVVFTGVVQGQSKTDPALNKLTADFETAYNAGDAAKVAAFYADDAIVMPPDEQMVKGRSAIEARLKSQMQRGKATLKLTPTASAISGDQAYRSVAQSVEDIHIVRSLRLSRAEPSTFCSPSKTTFSDILYEDRYTFAAVETRSRDGFVTNARKEVGSARGCFGQTPNPTALNIFIEGEISGISFTGRGQCAARRSDFPEPGLRAWHCFIDLSGLSDPYVGGFLTTNTVTSRTTVGAVSDPPGYVQPSIATIRLWKRRGGGPTVVR